MQELKAAIKYLEDLSFPPVATKIAEFKGLYEKEHGLPYGHPTMEKIETFIKWMKDNGAKFDKISMRYYAQDYRGVHTVKKIQQNELFLHVPHKLIITRKLGMETPLGAKIVKSGIHLDWDYLAYITTFLLTQFHDPNSFWKPYMDVYPKDVSSFPMFYSEEDKKLLKGSPIMEQIHDEFAEIEEEYNQIVEEVPEFKEFTLEEYAKNKTLVISRIFYVTVHGKIERIMVPLADMFNHHFDRLGETYWQYDDKDDAFIVQAQKPISIGDPICESYGQKPNYRFLFYYGFLIDNNPQNCVYINLMFNSDDHLAQQKGNMIGAYIGRAIKSFKFYENWTITPFSNEKFLAHLRLIEYKGDLNMLSPYLKPVVSSAKSCSFEKRKFRCPPITVDNEKAALMKLKLIAENTLQEYPDTYEKDMEILKAESIGGEKLTFNQKNSIMLRSGEKKILNNMISMAEIALTMIGMESVQDAEKFIEKAGKNLPYPTYFKKSLIPFLHKVK